ncbi:hypothetical protein [Streptomyces sulphureus]|nr:hypothetical protein [Streptomyces sulphureus]
MKRIFAWMGNYRCVTTRWDRRADHFFALAATLICYRHYNKQSV